MTSGPSIKDDESYLRAPLLPRCEDPLEWWKSKGSHLYPSLLTFFRHNIERLKGIQYLVIFISMF
ncbi:hypothetical protein HPB48_006850 [Haemaphysalis longicornis]|uniref:HAT C-terminal dimerisation domain-containing protein n=1 Tax=Haemaphysalis longicornis TaxID=44386 RepID=A0A9J6FG30_HAELO|nr:hypothetical protein HPB48_006850 [Haemaphysalis longicornis]